MALVGVSAVGERVKPGVRRRRRYSVEEKRRLVEEYSPPGASIAAVALRHGINANMLFTWRRQVQRGQRAARPNAVDVPAAFVPVGVIGRPAPPIEIEPPNGARLRVSAGVDAGALCGALRALKEAW